MLGDLDVFLAVAERQSFARAAEALGMTPAGASKAVRRLEARLGAPLFTRTTRQVRLTPAGRAFDERARAAAALIREGREAVALTQEEASGTVRLSAPPILAGFLAGALPPLTLRHPALRLHLGLTDRSVDLPDERVDIAIRVGEVAAPHLTRRRLARLRWVTVAAPAYLARYGRPERPEDLAAHACLRFVAPSGREVPWRFEQGGRPQELRVQGPLSTDLGTALIDAALAGAGIAQVFRHMVQGPLDSGQLVPLLVDAAAAGPELHALTAPEAGRAARVRCVLDTLYAAFATF